MENKLCVGLICGGYSTEYKISLKSAAYIMRYIDTNRFKLIILWINKKGDWYIVEDNLYINFFYNYCNQNNCSDIDLQKILNDFFCDNISNALKKINVIFPVTHGALGEDGALQGFLNIMNLPYVGSDVLGSSICMNKDITKHILRDSGLLVAQFRTFFLEDRQSMNFLDFSVEFGLPFFVKPVNQGSSIGISKVYNNNMFNHAIDVAFLYSDKIIVEACILGRELECAVLGNTDLETSIYGEIIKKNNHFYTYSNKYNSNYSSFIVIPALIDTTISNEICCIVKRVFKLLNCFGMARVDIFLTVNNQIIINEVNTLPGFTNNSMYPKLWEAIGLTPKFLLTKLIELAVLRHRNKHNYNCFY